MKRKTVELNQCWEDSPELLFTLTCSSLFTCQSRDKDNSLLLALQTTYLGQTSLPRSNGLNPPSCVAVGVESEWRNSGGREERWENNYTQEFRNRQTGRLNSLPGATQAAVVKMGSQLLLFPKALLVYK